MDLSNNRVMGRGAPESLFPSRLSSEMDPCTDRRSLGHAHWHRIGARRVHSSGASSTTMTDVLTLRRVSEAVTERALCCCCWSCGPAATRTRRRGSPADRGGERGQEGGGVDRFSTTQHVQECAVATGHQPSSMRSPFLFVCESKSDCFFCERRVFPPEVPSQTANISSVDRSCFERRAARC